MEYRIENSRGHMCQKNGCLNFATKRLNGLDDGGKVYHVCDEHLGMIELLAEKLAMAKPSRLKGAM